MENSTCTDLKQSYNYNVINTNQLNHQFCADGSGDESN